LTLHGEPNMKYLNHGHMFALTFMFLH